MFEVTLAGWKVTVEAPEGVEMLAVTGLDFTARVRDAVGVPATTVYVSSSLDQRSVEYDVARRLARELRW